MSPLIRFARRFAFATGVAFAWHVATFAVIGGVLAGSASLATADDAYIGEQPIELSAEVLDFEASRIEAIARAMPSATSIFVPGGGGGGSGVVIDPDGFALTNFHVTSPAGNYMQCSMADGEIYDAVIVGIDPVGDLAMIQLLPSGVDSAEENATSDGDASPNDDSSVEDDAHKFPAATIGDSYAARAGDWSFVIGNPFLLAGDLQPTVTWGMLSGVGRYQYPSGTLLEYGNCLQTDASINPGNSGGPIYDAEGNVIGIVGRCSFEKRGRVNVGVGYAISIAQAMNFAGTLRVGRIADHATLGATVATDPDGGVRVSNILPSSDAYRRGLRYDSEILRIDSRSVTTANEVQNLLATYPARWRIPITFRDDDGLMETVVRLQSVHAEDELLQKMAGASPPPPPRPDGPKDIEDSPPDSPEDQDPSDANPSDEDSKNDGDATPPKPASDAKRSEKDLPSAVAERFEAKRGFANYYFNRVAQDQFIQAVRHSPWPSRPDGDLSWHITGIWNGTPVSIMVDNEVAALTVDQNTTRADDFEVLADAVRDQSVAAILAPLSALHRMTIEGPDRFGETYVAGTAPLAGVRPLRTVTRATDGPAEVQFYNHPSDQHLEVVEWTADNDADPAELWIDRDDSGQVSRLRLRFGVQDRFVMDIKSWNEKPESDPENGERAADATNNPNAAAEAKAGNLEADNIESGNEA